jgi:uncharacterized protein
MIRSQVLVDTGVLVTLIDRRDLIQLLSLKQVQVCFDLDHELEQVMPLLGRYASVPMSLADAELIRMAELFPRSLVFTLDSDFHG